MKSIKLLKVKFNQHFRMIVGSFLSAIVFIGLLFFIIQPMRIQGVSMEPAYTNQQTVFVSRLLVLLQELSEGDVVVIRHPVSGKKVVKRIVATAGSHIIDKDYSIDFYVPLGMYYVLGDNPAASEDSRFFGCIREADVIARVIN